MFQTFSSIWSEVTDVRLISGNIKKGKGRRGSTYQLTKNKNIIQEQQKRAKSWSKNYVIDGKAKGKEGNYERQGWKGERQEW